MIRPTGRAVGIMGAGLALAAAPAVFGDAAFGDALVGVWLAGLAAIAAALVLEFALLPGRRRVDVTLEAPAVVHLGLPAMLELGVTARSKITATVAVELDGDAEPLPAPTLRTEPDKTLLAELPLRPRRRGTLQVVAVHVRWTGPLGLLWSEHRTAASRTIKVIPDVLTTRRQALRIAMSREFQAGLKVERYSGDGSEFESLREFVVGMDHRAVDWKASARHRMLLARQFRAERDHQVMLCIDTGRLMGEPLEGMPRLDHAIHAALQLGHICLRTGDRVGMYAFAERGLATLAPQAGMPALHAIQDRLAALAYSSQETNYTRALTELLQPLRRRTLVVLFTEFVDSISAELMVPNIQRLARRHLVLFVALRDPLLPRLAAAAPASSLDLHRAVIAESMIHERELVLERIRMSGAQVVDAYSHEVGPELISRYLQVKRRELV